MTTNPPVVTDRDVIPLRDGGGVIARAAQRERRDSVTRYERFVKPVLDRIGALLLLVLLLPIIALTAAAVLLVLGRPILYRQTRTGQFGRPVEMLKFRTMHASRRDAQRPYDGPDRRKRHKAEDDPRHTRLGMFLRRFSLDELPQLWNVLRGDLSLVGPRPELASVVRRYEPWQHRRHAIKPGITGLWQVTERDERGEMHLHVETDLRYVRALSFSTDLAILLATLPAVLGFHRDTFGLSRVGRSDPAAPDAFPERVSA